MSPAEPRPEAVFSGRAQDYAAARSGYPRDLFLWLTEAARLAPGAIVADVGAGTGKFTESLLDCGFTVHAVEPNAEMLETAMSRLLAHPDFYPHLGRGEATGLPDASVDLVTCAAAFHWMDADAFAQECRRILRPGGQVLLTWLVRDELAPLNRAHAELLRAFCPGFTGLAHGHDECLPRLSRFFASYQTRAFDADAVQDREAFIRRTLSSSYALRPDDAVYADFVAALGALFDDWQEGGRVRVRTRALCYLGAPADPKGEEHG
ncbi:MAG: class I SAM-dependent methyltransferase [Candidatus Spyradocola sp.]|jgi:ubiquinone/menaquinone biosynthesis C-methylase UbiE